MKSSFTVALAALAMLLQACGSDTDPDVSRRDAGSAGRDGSGGGGSGGGGSGGGGSPGDSGDAAVDVDSGSRDATDASLGMDADVSIEGSASDGADAADERAPDSNLDVQSEGDALLSDRPAPDDAGDSAGDGPAAEDAEAATAEVGTDAMDAGVVDGQDEGEAGLWTPAQLSNLALWLDAETNVVLTNGVTTWTDRSVHGHVAAQSLADLRPAYVESVIHGHSVIRFDGQNDSFAIPDAPSLRFGTGDFVVEIVASFTNATNVGDGYGLLFAKQNADPPFAGPALWANYAHPTAITAFTPQLQFGVALPSTVTSLNDGVARLYGARRLGSFLETRLNGAQNRAGMVPSIDLSATGQFAFIGGQQTSGGVIQALKGDIAELVAVGGGISASDLAKLETYLITKYGL